MTMRLSQVEVLERAERLASTLAAGDPRVEKNVLLAVVGDFMTDRRPDLHRLRRILLLLGQGSGGQLKRGGNYGGQVRAVVAQLTKLIDAEALDSDDYKSLFGWTARLLLVRSLPPPAPGATGPQTGKGPRESKPKSSPKTTTGSALGTVGQETLSSLEKFKRQLEEREKKEEK
jgi:hypothetical protein